MKEKIGVYICHCGGNISDYVDVEKVRKAVMTDPGVSLVKTTMFTCSDSSQKEIVEDIKKNSLDAMVVASCSPKLHLLTFRDVAERAGLNVYNYVQANIREQCSWAHSDKTDLATDKAVRIIRAAITRVRHSIALEQIEINALNSAAIIGAGISGMRSAIELADMGTDVYLIEKDHFVGGRVAQWGELFPTDENGESIVERLYSQLKTRNNITLFTGSEIKSLSGNVGNFKLGVEISPRYGTGECSKEKLMQAIEACPVNIPDAFNFYQKEKKAIYKNYKNALPDRPAIDMNKCNSCGKCAEILGNSIDLNQAEETIELNIGAILLSTGFSPYEPEEDEYGYGKIDGVLTLPQFRRIIELSNDCLAYKGKEIKNVAFIYCVGSRETNGENKHCSRVCCTSTIHTSLKIKEKFNNIQSTHLFRDIRTYGKRETLYNRATEQGDIFLKFDENEPPVVLDEGGRSKIIIKDLLTEREEIEIYPDLIVLVTGINARENDSITNILKVPVGSDKFFNEIHTKLRPVETVIDGIYIAGSCQGPKNIPETMSCTLAATAKAYSLIGHGKIKLEPTVAEVNRENCQWCGKCKEVCTYNALEKTEYNGKAIASVNTTLCKGCGACSTVCAPDAIEIVGYTNVEIESMIDAFAMHIESAREENELEADAIKEGTAGPMIKKIKALPEIGKKILKSLENEPKSVSKIAEEINHPVPEVMYILMSLRKYGFIADTGEIDEDEAYLYQLKV